MAKHAREQLQRMDGVEEKVAEMDGVIDTWNASDSYGGFSLLRSSRDLLRVLHQAGVRPFISEQVDAYKMRFQRSFNFRQEFMNWQSLVFCGIASVFVLAVLTGFFGWFFSPTIGGVGILTAVLAFVCGYFFIEEVPAPELSRGSWNRHQLSAYTRPIPIDVLRVMRHVREVSADVTFEVDEFATHVVHDPFLIARLGDQRYYIAVWDEPTFDATQRL